MRSGIGLGTAIALLASWTANHSIGWAVIHAMCGWFYVFYRLAGCG